MIKGLNWKLIIVHLAAWMAYLLLLTLYSFEVRSFGNALTRSFVSISIQAVVFYANLLVFLPLFLEKKKYLIYAFSLIIMVIAAAWIYDEMMHSLLPDEIKELIESRERKMEVNPDRPPKHQFGMRNRRLGDWNKTLLHGRYLSNGFFIIISLFISTIYHNMLVSRRREKEKIQIQNQMLEAESKMLKWQINPHFLFNTLNNLYSMSQLKSAKTPDAIHRLSQMLRYVIYDCNQEYVSLGQEISYIQSYIELQMLKDEEGLNVKYTFEPVNPQLKITPMLLISFVENSFKHSNIEDTENSWIEIKLASKDNRLKFSVRNSIPEQQSTKDKSGGIGLENVKKRLNLLYPDKHYLNITTVKNLYSVTLMLELNEN